MSYEEMMRADNLPIEQAELESLMSDEETEDALYMLYGIELSIKESVSSKK